MNSKKKICKRCEKEVYIFARGLCKSCDMVVNSKKYMIDRTKKEKTKKPKAKSISKLKTELDDIYSLYIRHLYADSDGNIKCYTCDTIKPIKEMQNGHFWSRKHLSTRWNDDNCRPQCLSCNFFNNGNYRIYTREMLNELGEDKYQQLEDLKNTTFKINKVWILEQTEYYTEKVKQLKEQKSL